MAIDVELRRRVERLLGGQILIEDLNRIFLGLRERFYGREAFQEIGHFIAHADERTHGVISKRARDYFLYMRIIMPVILKTPGFIASGSQFGAALKANLNLFLDDEIGMRRDVAESIVGRIATKVDRMQDGRLITKRPLTEKENELGKRLTAVIISRPIFTADVLCRDFIEVLAKNNILRGSEAINLSYIRDKLAAFAIWRMHGCTIILPDGAEATLHGSCQDNHVGVYVTVPRPSGSDSRPYIALPVFIAETDVTSMCDDDLLYKTWDFPIELSVSGKLIKL